ncbi:putative sensor-like histidine kinase [compost metagenome]
MHNQLYIRSESSNRLTDSFLLISVKSLQQIQDKNKALWNKIVYAGLLSAFVTSVLIALALERLLRPLGDLLKGLMRFRAGRFETRIDVRSQDELAFIGDSFNAMAEHVEQLIKEVYLTRLSEQEAELKALQAQLNPHFLYNFFNEVYWKLHAHGEQETAGLIAAVAGMLRHSLMPVRVPTTVREEVKQIRNYVKIQAELFETDLETDIQIEEAVMEYEVMRSLLQPLVENVFHHAFRNKLSDKMLRIIMKEKEGFLHIEIADNGCGMEQSLIERLLYEESSPFDEYRERESLGVRSVVRRIELLHGPPYRMEMESAAELGTTVHLYLPARTADKGVRQWVTGM